MACTLQLFPNGLHPVTRPLDPATSIQTINSPQDRTCLYGRALDELRHRVAHDDLPLLRMLSVEPLQVQSSHLSFQEFFTARAICDLADRHGSDQSILRDEPPWQWQVWWANTVELGAGMGQGFGRGLLVAAGVKGSTLNLNGKLGGHKPTALAAVAQCMRCLTKINLSSNGLKGEEIYVIAEAFVVI